MTVGADLPRVDVVVATRLSADPFWRDTATGQSLRRLRKEPRLFPKLHLENTHGLPLIYNHHLESAQSADYVVYIHDDVWIDDFFIYDRLLDGLARFDVLGVVGSKAPQTIQPSWAFTHIDPKSGLVWDQPSNFSGGIAHGTKPCGEVTWFGKTPAAVEVLDGVMLAINRKQILAAGARFDPQFKFHFYDLDFCRSARAQGLRLGTWPIALTHQSGGHFGSPEWSEAYRNYLHKWGQNVSV